MHTPVPAPAASTSPLLPVLSVIAGIAAFSAMDAAMKAASLALGVMTALFLRNLCATLLTLPLWLAAGRPLPSAPVFRVHVLRAAITAAMAVLFFYGLVRIPMAEGIAISFVAPIIALYLAAVMLGERIHRRAIVASALGVIGVGVIGAGRFGQGAYTQEAVAGTAAILLSALFYAVNLVLQRKQALLARPVEIAFFQNLNVTVIFAFFTPFFFVRPDAATMGIALAGGLLATMALLFLSWGYARAEAQVLVPIEYTGFLWAALLGWWLFDETVDVATLAGALLIVIGCWIGAGTRSTRNDLSREVDSTKV